MVIKEQAKMSSAAFCPAGKWVVTGSQDCIARLWEASTGRSVRELLGHKAYVTHVAFSPDGKFILTSSLDGIARVWETDKGRTIAVIHGIRMKSGERLSAPMAGSSCRSRRPTRSRSST